MKNLNQIVMSFSFILIMNQSLQAQTISEKEKLTLQAVDHLADCIKVRSDVFEYNQRILDFNSGLARKRSYVIQDKVKELNGPQEFVSVALELATQSENDHYSPEEKISLSGKASSYFLKANKLMGLKMKLSNLNIDEQNIINEIFKNSNNLGQLKLVSDQIRADNVSQTLIQMEAKKHRITLKSAPNCYEEIQEWNNSI